MGLMYLTETFSQRRVNFPCTLAASTKLSAPQIHPTKMAMTSAPSVRI